MNLFYKLINNIAQFFDIKESEEKYKLRDMLSDHIQELTSVYIVSEREQMLIPHDEIRKMIKNSLIHGIMKLLEKELVISSSKHEFGEQYKATLFVLRSKL